MSERKREILDAATLVFQEHGPHGLTHRAVDAAACLPQGSTSNVFRTRQALAGAVAEEVASQRLSEGTGPHDEDLTLAWMELLIQARRDASIADAIAPIRQRMVALLEANRSDTLSLSTPELAALATGVEYAEVTTGVRLPHVWEMLPRADSQDS